MTEILDESAVKDIETRADAATKGPWNQSALAGMYIVADGADYATVASVGEYNTDGSIHLAFADAEANLDFIAHAREDIPALCATVKHLRAENRRLMKERDQARDEYVCADLLATVRGEERKQAFGDAQGMMEAPAPGTMASTDFHEGFEAMRRLAKQILERAVLQAAGTENRKGEG